MIELGMPFSDPMADGPAIQAGLRALKAGMTLRRRSRWCARFRAGRRRHADRADGLLQPDLQATARALPRRRQGAGVDGLIVVDLPPEEDESSACRRCQAGLNFIRLATPTTDDKRLPAVLQHLGLRLLRLDHRHHRHGTGAADHVARRSRGCAATPTCRSRRLRHPHAGAGRRDRRRRRRRRGRLGHRRRGPKAELDGAQGARVWRRCWPRSRPRRGGVRGAARPHDSAGARADELAHQLRPPPIRGAGQQAEVPDNLWHKCPSASR
jgi:hypothetical protein